MESTSSKNTPSASSRHLSSKQQVERGMSQQPWQFRRRQDAAMAARRAAACLGTGGNTQRLSRRVTICPCVCIYIYSPGLDIWAVQHVVYFGVLHFYCIILHPIIRLNMMREIRYLDFLQVAAAVKRPSLHQIKINKSSSLKALLLRLHSWMILLHSAFMVLVAALY